MQVKLCVGGDMGGNEQGRVQFALLPVVRQQKVNDGVTIVGFSTLARRCECFGSLGICSLLLLLLCLLLHLLLFSELLLGDSN